MAISEDASTPAVVQRAANTSGTVTTATFSPPANSMLVVLVNFMYFAHPALATLTCKDSLNNTFTAGPQQHDGAESTTTGIFTRYYAAAPGSITVTVTDTSTSTAAAHLAVRVLNGAASSQTGAAGLVAAPVQMNNAITSSTSGSWVYLACGTSEGVFGGLTPFSRTTSINTWGDPISGDTSAIGRATNPTGTPGAETLGWVKSANCSIALLEVIPATTSGGGSGSSTLVQAVPAPLTWTAGQIPIAGGAALPSPDFGGFNNQIRDAFLFMTSRTVLRVHQTTSQSIPTGAFTKITLDTLDEDAYSGWNAGTWTYTAPATGWYFIIGFVAWNGTSVTNTSGTTGLLVNGTTTYQGVAAAPPGGSMSWGSPGAWGQFLRAGVDTIALQGFQGTGAALGTHAAGSPNYYSHLEILWAAGG